MDQGYSNSKVVWVGSPREKWHWFAGLLGLPAESIARGIKHPFAIFSFVISFIVVLVYGEIFGREAFLMEFAYTPALWERHFGLTMLMSFFMHAGWLHLLGNAYYFVVFGDDVEDELKFFPFLGLVFGCHIAGYLLYSFLHFGSEIPLVGASAGVSGIMGYYMVRLPKRKITYMFMFLFAWSVWIQVPDILAMLWKFGWEILIVQSYGEEYTGVAHSAHLGGALFGIVCALMFNSAKGTGQPTDPLPSGTFYT